MGKENNFPKFSIITAVYNGGKFLEKSIQSIINQSYDNYEYIIIDGGSTDNTIDIIKKYNDKIDYWVSENDKGIGDAWNKGIQRARGKIIGLLNAGDEYERNNLEIVSNMIFEEDAIITYGKTIFTDNDGNVKSTSNNKMFHHSFYTSIYRGFGFYHTTCFVTKKVYELVGLFDDKISIAVDVDFLIRAYLSKVKFIQIPTSTQMLMGGISQLYERKGYLQYLDVLKKHGFNRISIEFWRVLHASILIFKRILSVLYLQFFFITIYLFNIVYNSIPSHAIRNLFLRVTGCKIGAKSIIHGGVKFFHFGKLFIGTNTTINFGCYLDNRRSIKIGNNVMIAHNTKIYTLGHDIDDPYLSKKGAAVKIDDYVCIFSNVLIMPGVTINKGAVIMAGSVVTKDVPQYNVVGGNPAKFIRMRSDKLSYVHDYRYWFAQ